MLSIRSALAAFIVLLLLEGPAVAADPVALNPAHPDRYVVRKGDTLWDISARFLREPWRWPDIWEVNPEIANPHLIYPGDILNLSYVDGQPRLRMSRGMETLKLIPKIRVIPLSAAIPTIPIDAIKPFLSRSYVLDPEQIDAAPYVVHFQDEHIVGGAGNGIYVRSIDSTTPQHYDVVRPGKAYRDPDSKEVLGYEALYVGDALLVRTGDPATLFLTSTQLETLVGDRLLPVSSETVLTHFQPHPAAPGMTGRIISVLNGVFQIGQYNVVVLNKGETDGLSVGDVLDIYQGGNRVPDPIAGGWREKVTLPYEKAGVLLVFRTFSRVSFALVMSATRAIHIHDTVRAPEA